MTTSNPLAVYGFIVLTLILVVLSWRTVRSMWRNHGSVATMRKRQLIDAQKAELMYAQAAEYYTALATGARQTIDRLTIPVGLDETVATLKGASHTVNVINSVTTAPE
jgi:hypothetical protein